MFLDQLSVNRLTFPQRTDRTEALLDRTISTLAILDWLIMGR